MGSKIVGLDLELGRGSALRGLGGGGGWWFTIPQLEELQLQALIFNYISASLPVPNHLLLPICQSLSLSSFPTWISPTWLESRRGIEEEPWRCRRTDGKKWRCAKEALPRHKYCERHVHRGRHRRSRMLADSNPDNNVANVTSVTSN